MLEERKRLMEQEKKSKMTVDDLEIQRRAEFREKVKGCFDNVIIPEIHKCIETIIASGDDLKSHTSQPLKKVVYDSRQKVMSFYVNRKGSIVQIDITDNILTAKIDFDILFYDKTTKKISFNVDQITSDVVEETIVKIVEEFLSKVGV